MISTFSYFKVNIIDKKYYSELGSEFDNTAEIILYDKYNKEILRLEKGYIETSEIYDLILNGKDINLSDCYIKNFSLSAYRRIQILEKKSTVKIKSITAVDAFFDSDFDIDFSFAEFENSNVNFSKTCFENGNVSFNSTNFGEGDVDFSYCLFRSGNVD